MRVGWTAPVAVLTLAGVNLLSALLLAASGILSKRLTLTSPPRQLIGPLLVLNAATVAVLLPFSEWTVSPAVLALLGLEAVVLVSISLAAWDLYGSGSAGATLLALSVSPVFALVLTAILLPNLFRVVPAIGACIIVVSVVSALSQAFSSLGTRRSLGLLLLAASGGGTLSVTSRLLGDLGVGIVPNYFFRNLAGGLLALLIFGPRSLPRAVMPQLVGRTMVTVPYHLLFLSAVRLGSPATALAAVATAPLMVFAFDALRSDRRMNPRQVTASVIVVLTLPLLYWDG